jgi:hypothetical protein
MMKFESGASSYDQHAGSPPIDHERESIRLALSRVSVADGWVGFWYHLTMMFPTDVAIRYRSLGKAMVLMVHDLDQRDGFGFHTANDFIKIPPESEGPNVLSDPAIPISPRGTTQAESYRGGWVNGTLSFPAPRPLRRPSIYIYAVLENYVSNVVALDLVEPAIVSF